MPHAVDCMPDRGTPPIEPMTTGGWHVADDHGRITRQILRDVRRDYPCRGVGTAARGKADDEIDGLAFKGDRRLRLGGRCETSNNHGGHKNKRKRTRIFALHDSLLVTYSNLNVRSPVSFPPAAGRTRHARGSAY